MDMNHGSPTATSSGAMSSSTGAAGGSMSMGGGCKISMLWNWNTVGSCFISKDWQIKSIGMFVGSVIGIFLLVILVEFTRRAAREYDRRIARAAFAALPTDMGSLVKNGGSTSGLGVAVRPTFLQQAIRATFYMVQFGAGYMLMLLAMYYNGYILIFGIFFGAWAGFFLASWDTVAHGDSVAKDCCC